MEGAEIPWDWEAATRFLRPRDLRLLGSGINCSALISAYARPHWRLHHFSRYGGKFIVEKIKTSIKMVLIMHKICFFESGAALLQGCAAGSEDTDTPTSPWGWFFSTLLVVFGHMEFPQSLPGTGFLTLCFRCNLCPDGGSPKLLLYLIPEAPGSPFHSPHSPSPFHLAPCLFLLCICFSSGDGRCTAPTPIPFQHGCV